MDYKDLNFDQNNPLIDKPELKPIFEGPSLTPLPDILTNTTKKVDKVIDDEIITPKMVGLNDTWSGGKKKNTNWWCWIDRSNLLRIDPDALKRYESISTPNPTGSRTLPPRENDVDI